MPRYALSVFLFVALAGVAGCAGHGGSALPALSSVSASHNHLPALPHFTKAMIQSARRVSLGNRNAWHLPPVSTLMRSVRSAAARRLTAPGRARGQSSAGPGDSEVVGVAINPGGPYTGMVDFQTVYQPFTVPQSNITPQIQLGYPAGASGTSELFAPLILPPNGSCLAPSTLYANSGTSTVSLFVALDFCSGNVDAVLPIDNSANTQQYIGLINGLPGFYSVTLTFDQVPTSTSTWYTLLYNFTSGQFDLLTYTVGLSSFTSGLGIFDSAFVQGQCPVTPTLAAEGMQLYNGTTGGFEPLAPTMTGTTSVAIPVGTGDNCFLDDTSGPASFSFSVLNANTDWQVTANPPPVAINEFSSGVTAGADLNGITSGPDGNLWFTELVGNRVGRITPSGTVSEFSSGITPGVAPSGITSGPDGNLWFAEPGTAAVGRIARITTSGSVTEFSTGISANSQPCDITSGPDGNLWFAECAAFRIGRITTTGSVTEFSTGISGAPGDITSGPDGNLWFTEYAANRIGRITPTGTVTEFSSGISTGASLSGITSGPDGNLWFAEGAGRIGRVTPSGSVTEFSSGISAGAQPGDITSGPDGNLWFTEHIGKRIARITPSGAVTEFSSGITSAPGSIAGGPDGNLWFTESAPDRIGRILP